MWIFKYILLLFFAFGMFDATAQTIIPPKLECVYNHTNGDVFIQWQNRTNGCGAFLYYTVYGSKSRSGPYDSLAKLTSINADTFLHAGANGNIDTWYYYIKAWYACPGYKMATSDTFTNAKLPTARMKVVSVVNGRAIIEWYGIKNPQVFGYVIYRVTDNGVHFVPIYTVTANDTSFIDTASRPSKGPVYYTVAATDSCGNLGDYDIKPHHTIFVTDSIDQCALTIKLKWNEYDNWPKGVKKFIVYVGLNKNTPIAIDSFDDGTFSYTYKGVNSGDSLTYFIGARSWNKLLSLSNVITKKIHVFQPVSDLYITSLLVRPDNTVDVSFSMDPSSSVAGITIQRSDDGVNFTNGAIISVPKRLTVVNTYNDYLANGGELSLYYRLKTTDSCSRIDYSNIARTVFIDGFALPTLRNHLEWNDYSLKFGNEQYCNLYRRTSLDTLWHFVRMFIPGTPYYEDSIGKLSSPDGRFCYYLECFDTVTFPGVAPAISYTTSNVFCINQATRVYMPNVYEPAGRYQRLKPFLFFEGGIKTYSFAIFNRYGETVFSTSNPDQWWDGHFNGNLVQQDVYTYLIEVVDENKKTVQKAGTVLVLR